MIPTAVALFRTLVPRNGLNVCIVTHVLYFIVGRPGKPTEWDDFDSRVFLFKRLKRSASDASLFERLWELTRRY